MNISHGLPDGEGCMTEPDALRERKHRCPKCYRADNVRPFALGLLDNRYPVTVEYECTTCNCRFKPEPQESGYLTRKVMS